MAFGHGTAAPLIEQYCHAALLALARCHVLVNRTETLLGEWRQRLGGTRSDSLVWRLLPLILARPVFKAELLAEATGGSKSALFRAIGILSQQTVVRQVSQRLAHGVHWFAPEVMGLLTPVHSGRPFLPRFSRLKGYS
jgi:hypothetical protein